MRTLNCVVIGYNDVPIENSAKKFYPFRKHSGTYGEIKTNSILLEGKRITYMDLLNKQIHKIHNVDLELNAFKSPSLGAVYLANFLKHCGFEVEVVNFYNSEKDKLIQLLDEQPHAIAITTTYYVEEDPIKEVVQFVRQYSPKTCIIVGGPYIFNLFNSQEQKTQELIFKSIGADVYITDAQGEATLAQVLNILQVRREFHIGLKAIPNLVFLDKKENKFYRTIRTIENNDLNENKIDWSLVEPKLYKPIAYMRTSRSCPFKCEFCNYPTMSGDYTLAEVSSVIDELRYLASNGTKYVVFVDDTLNVPPARFKKLLKGIISEKLDIRWVSFFRCSNADDEMFDLMIESGCLGVYLGIESGDDQIVKYMNKYATVKQYKEGIHKLHERGIITFGSFITGYPGETRQTVLNTIEFIEEVKPSFYNTQLYFHDPLAPINKRREEFGIQGSYYSWNHKTMNWQEAAEWVDYTLANVNGSVPLPLYGFSIWSIPYLLNQGFTIEHIMDFAKSAKNMLVKSFDDVQQDYSKEENDLLRVLSTWTLK